MMNVETMAPSQDRRLEKFFRTELLRIAEQYQQDGRTLMAGSPDDALESYYVRRSKTKMSKEDFEDGSVRSTSELAIALREMWQEQGFTELSEQATQMAKLADKLKESQQETSEVSPFVYVMY